MLIGTYSLGRIDVARNGDSWSLRTTNIRRWHFEAQEHLQGDLQSISLDGHTFPANIGSKTTYLLSPSFTWTVSTTSAWRETERSDDQLGDMFAILASKGPFSIVIPPDSPAYYTSIALQISRNFYQYFGADTEILSAIPESLGNVILLDRPGESKSVSYSDEAVVVTDAAGRKHRYPAEDGLGAIFLQPLGKGRLLLSVWGVDEEGLRLAARLVPLRTGVGAPELVVVGKEMARTGVAGVKALGVFDSEWRVAGGSYL